MRALHVLHHSAPYLSGYSIRSSYIIDLQRAAGIEPRVVTSGQHTNGELSRERIRDVDYVRTPKPKLRLPFLREYGVMADLEKQVEIAAQEFQPDIIHAHSP